ncbi:hypothetical protein J0H58_00180 [bacterium]|nr:hypothetical protein [bacterium]
MSVRRTRPATSRPQTNPTSLALGSSTAGWYAEWKARKQAAVAAEPEQVSSPADDAAEALAKWLTTDGK